MASVYTLTAVAGPMALRQGLTIVIDCGGGSLKVGIAGDGEPSLCVFPPLACLLYTPAALLTRLQLRAESRSEAEGREAPLPR